MGENSKIEWTHHTFNPWWGCVRVSPGCVNCYAETFDKRVHGKDDAHWGVKSDRRFFGDKHWNEPLKWNRKAQEEGARKRVFCASMADVFEDREDLYDHRMRLFYLIEETPWLDWLLLTKRPENMVRLAGDMWVGDWPRNVWAGCTAEDQQRYDERLLHLVRVPVRIRFLSCEPLLSQIDLSLAGTLPKDVSPLYRPVADVIHWVIAGGESGAGARPMDLQWARSLRDQCAAAGVPYFFKQIGGRTPKAGGRELDGRTWDEFPITQEATC